MKLTDSSTFRLLKQKFWDVMGDVPVPEDDGCWEWPMSRTNGKYGQVHIPHSGHRGRMYATHRLSYEIFIGPIDDDAPFVLHKCDNPCCCNPSHLFSGTPLDNVRDMDAKGRRVRRGASGDRHSSKTHPEKQARGERVNTAKITSIDVEDIRNEYQRGVRQSILAMRYGLHQSQISKIVRRESWKHIV